MKNVIIASLMMLHAVLLNAQTVSVVDITTRETIPGVVVYSNNPKASVTTNAKGKADISLLKGADSIYFKHVSYKSSAFSYPQIEAKQFEVELAESNISLNEVVVSANRWEEEKIKIPYRVEKISLRETQFQNPQTAADLLGSGGSVYIQKSQQAGGSPMLRGFATNRVMLVVDGVRMNNAIYRAGNLQNVISLDGGSVESVETLFGPGAVMYGSDAIGGVMDFHTLQPKLSQENTMFSGSAFSRYSTANKENSQHIDFNVGFKKLAFLSSFTYSDFDDLRTGSNGNDYFLRPVYQITVNNVDFQVNNKDPKLQVGSGYSQVNFLQKVLFKPTGTLDVDYGFHYSATSDAPRYDRLTVDANNNKILDQAEWYYGPQKWMMHRVGVTHSRSNSAYDKIRFVGAFQDYEESRHDRSFGNKRRRNQVEAVEAFSLNLDFDKSLGEKTALFYGAEGVYNLIGSRANRVHIETGVTEPTNTRYPNDATWQVYGIYASMRHNLTSKWIVNGGLRYSSYLIKADFDTSRFPFPFVHAENNEGALNGSLGLVYNPDQTWQVYVNAATGFRAPNMDDIGKVFGSESGTSLVVPNIDLKPEYAYNAEVGTVKTFSDAVKVDFSAYYTLLDNAMALRNFQYNGKDSIIYDGQLSQVQAIQNVLKANVYGIQAGIDVRLGAGFGLGSSINYQKGEEQSEDSLKYYPLRHAAPMFGRTRLTYERKNFKFDFYSDYNSEMKYEDLALTETAEPYSYAKDASGKPFVPGWYTLNFKAAWYVNKYLVLNAGVENITDQLYRTYASGISAPGRNFIVALRGRF